MFLLDPGSGIRDPGWKKSRIRDKRPGSAGLDYGTWEEAPALACTRGRAPPPPPRETPPSPGTQSPAPAPSSGWRDSLRQRTKTKPSINSRSYHSAGTYVIPRYCACLYCPRIEATSGEQTTRMASGHAASLQIRMITHTCVLRCHDHPAVAKRVNTMADRLLLPGGFLNAIRKGGERQTEIITQRQRYRYCHNTR